MFNICRWGCVSDPLWANSGGGGGTVGHNKANTKSGGPHNIKDDAGGQRKVKLRSCGQHNLNANPSHPHEEEASSGCLQMVKEEVKGNYDDPNDAPPPSSSHAKIEVGRESNKNVCFFYLTCWLSWFCEGQKCMLKRKAATFHRMKESMNQ